MTFTRITTNFDLGERRDRLCTGFRKALGQVLELAALEHLVVFDQNLDSFFQPLNAAGRFAVLEITLPPVAGLKHKRRLYGLLTELFLDYGVVADNTRIVLREVPAENWGLGGRAACDSDQ